MADSEDIKGTIFKIKRFAVHDGPGIRTAVFLKGCPLNCIWCHSPEGIDQNISIWYNSNTCITCGRCIESCPEDALSFSEGERKQIIINRDLCNLSGVCVTVCPTEAIQFTGEIKSTSEIISEILKDQLFYESSDGGVTLTGGEPLFQPEFTLSILKECKKLKIHTAIETSLHCEKELLMKVAEYVDLFIVDMKLADSLEHRKYTGTGNERIRENFSYIAESEKKTLVRIPLIPYVSDTDKNKRAIAEYVNSFNRAIPIEYLEYNPLAGNNYKRLNIPFALTKRI